jgi:hypothetical protein
VTCDTASTNEPDIMSRKHLAALAIVLAALSEPAAAELRGTPEEPPVFTAAEVAVITRNAVLATLIQDNPWAIRRVLDALASVSTTPNNGSKRAVGSAAPADATIDPLANPDLDQLQRVSPEALLDLFRLLKEAQPGSGGAKPQAPVKPASR